MKWRPVTSTLPKNREKLASAIIDELRKRSPELAALLRDNLRSGVRDYLREKLRLLPRILVPADLAAGLVDYLDWEHIERQISEKLGEEPTQELIRDEVLRFTLRVREYLRSAEAQEHLRELLARGSTKLEEILHDYLQEKTPGAGRSDAPFSGVMGDDPQPDSARPAERNRQLSARRRESGPHRPAQPAAPD
ncbi:MAG: hypothetical protein L6W00_16155 [Lentisphaeria bacterium]|nr:MAG: hypothetical protein L6W00_16155 [Lentisphaeria bacterium]